MTKTNIKLKYWILRYGTFVFSTSSLKMAKEKFNKLKKDYPITEYTLVKVIKQT